MIDYPITFKGESETRKEEDKWSLETSENLKTQMSPPKEFGGSDENPSPEDLFTASIQTCVTATFKSIADRKDLTYRKIETEIKASLERGTDTRPMIKNAEITVKVTGVKDKEKASEIASATEKNCFIHKSVKTQIKTEYNFK
ncbi:hypothetical protein AQV86_02610 [Nanohaloarchaea archaeon SG9]|nr:hypothetical protein AQV86_02610 [Nanohaloarchaea archaeon SG9]